MDVGCRGIDPKRDLKIFDFYRRLLKENQPDMVITYSHVAVSPHEKVLRNIILCLFYAEFS